VHSQLGQVDHQVVLGLGTLGLLAAALAWLGAERDARRRNAWAVAIGVALALLLLVSPGALLQILPVQAALVLFVLAGRGRAEAVLRARSAALAHGVAALVVAPASFASGPFASVAGISPLALTAFQPLWLGAGAGGLLAVAELWRRTGAGAGRLSRAAGALALAGAGCALAFVLLPELRVALSGAGGWFTREHRFLGTVQELRPLFYPADRLDPGFAARSLTPALFAFPLAWLFLAARRGLAPNARPKHALLLVWSGAFFALALAQERFANVFAPGLALVIGVAAAELHGIAQRRLAPPARLALGAGLAALVLGALAPAARDYGRLFAYSRFAHAQEEAPLPASWWRAAVIEDAARFLRDASPPTRGFLDASLRPEYGVLTPWDVGHLVRHRAERPTVQDNFGAFGDPRAFDLARDYFDAEDEEAAFRVAAELGARYTIATREGSGQTFGPSPHSVGQRLWRRLGNGAPAGSGSPATPGSGSPALGRHRLVWVGDRSGRPRDVERPAPDRVAVFELVPGARVAGRAAPGAEVVFELSLRAGRGRFPYRARTVASREGRYELRLPYPTDAPVSAEVGATGAYRVRSGGRSAALDVREADVRAGAAVAGPDLEEDA
jgi:dolichyl-diphosphooligosaccharide--protein glycosyltransferase